MGILKKLWNLILNVLAWLTQDSTRLHKAKRKTNVEHEAIAQQMRTRFWRL